MKNLGSPSTIEVLLHCHVSPEVHPRIDAPAVCKAIANLLRTGAIARVAGTTRHRYSTTHLGAAWVKALTLVPPPRLIQKAIFKDEQGRVLE